MNKVVIVLILMFAGLSSPLNSQTRIKMQKEGGVYTVPCEVNGLKLRFIFDTGASNVCISITEVLFMLKNGYLDYDDIKGSSKSQIADGSIVENTEIILREIKIGRRKLYDVKAVAMHNIAAPLLLGQSAIEQLGIIRLDGDELVITSRRKKSDATAKTIASTNSTRKTTSRSAASTGSASKSSNDNNAEKWLEEANRYYKKDMYEQAAKAYRKAHSIDNTVFGTTDYTSMGTALLKTGDEENAPKCFSIARMKQEEFKNMYLKDGGIENWAKYRGMVYGLEMMAYLDNDIYDRVISTGKEAINEYNQMNAISKRHSIYGYMAIAYSQKKEYKNSIEMSSAQTKYYVMEKYGKNVSLKDLERKGIEDEDIAYSFYRRALCYYLLDDTKNYEEHLKTAAAFGNQKAKDRLRSENLTAPAREKRASGNNRQDNSLKAKRYMVEHLTIDVPDSPDWKTEFKRNDNGVQFTAKSLNDKCAIIISTMKEVFTADFTTDIMLRSLGDNNGTGVTMGKKREGRFNMPGGVEVPYRFDDGSGYGTLNVFNKDGVAYIIIVVENNDSKCEGFTKICNSIRYRNSK